MPYIDRDDVLITVKEFMERLYDWKSDHDRNLAIGAAVELGVQLCKIRTADVRINIHAHWIDAEGIPVCSHCGHATEDVILQFDGTAYVSRLPYFCGNCCAKMDEEEE